jgi:hypothetical protein
MKLATTLLCLCTLAACSDKPPAPQAAVHDPHASAPAAAPWDAMKQDEQRARDVQKIVDKQAEQQRKQIEEQSR